MTNRLILLTVVVGLIILLVQNFSFTLPLVFLGMQTQPLPLALWILFSITAGGLTSVVISILFKFINFYSPQPSKVFSKSTTTRPPKSRVNYTTKEETISGNNSYRERVDEYDDDFDDWETDDYADDWDFDQPQPRKEFDTEKSRREDVSRSDTVYSYSSQTPKDTSVGKVESVFDADYRVIIPPYQPSPSQKDESNEDDDWSFFEDDEFEDDEDDKNKPIR